MIALDASVLVAYLAASDAHADRAHRVLARGLSEGLVIHPVTLAEVLVGPVRIGREADALAALDGLGVVRWQPGFDEPIELARLRARTRLRLPDCCVVSVALATGAALASFDGALVAAARELKLDVVD